MNKPTQFLPALACLLAGVTLPAMMGRAEDAPRQVLRVDFSQDAPVTILSPTDAGAAILTTDPNEEVAGKKSLKGDSRGSGAEWNEFFHSKTGLFPPKEAYTVSLDYKILAHRDNTKFYALFRQAGAGDQGAGWQEWTGEPGATGHVQMAFVNRDVANGILIVGIHNAGALAINNITITTDPANRPIFAGWPAPARTWKSPGNTAYYVDAISGNDANDGKSAVHAWRTLERVNSGEFAPNDRILLKSGGHWTGFLAPGGSGTAGKPVRITSYGSGPKPSVDAGGKWLATVSLHNGEYWDVGGLDIANRAPARVPHLAGVQVQEDNFGVAHDIRLHDLDIHDVMGSNVKSEGGGNGISCGSGGDKVRTRYDGLTIENCHLARTDRNGITLSAYYPRPEWPLSTRVVIRHNFLEDIGGDGIVPIGCDGCLIERNVLHGGRTRALDYAAGIWPWACDNTVVQYNEVSGMKGTNDGEGYDSDYDCRHSLFQYNLSHDNDGGFMLICNDGSQHLPWNVGNSGTIIRYNLSINDGLHTFIVSGPCQDTQIYNNTFYLGKSLNVPIVASGNWGGAWSDNTRFWNNLFYVDGKAHFDFGGLTNTVFDHNAFWGDIAAPPADPDAITADPKLAAPGSRDLKGYVLQSGSPLRHAGKTIHDNGGRDFWGHSVPATSPSDIGADQVN